MERGPQARKWRLEIYKVEEEERNAGARDQAASHGWRYQGLRQGRVERAAHAHVFTRPVGRSGWRVAHAACAAAAPATRVARLTAHTAA